jgi:predicted metal-binding protein
MARTEMMENVIRKFGFEDNVTIAFCMYAEDPRATQESVEQIYNKLIEE